MPFLSIFYCIFINLKANLLKKSQITADFLHNGQKRPNFWILDLCACFKKVGLGAAVLKILSCTYWGSSYKTNLRLARSQINLIDGNFDENSAGKI